MFGLTKALMVIWLLVCGLFGACSVFLGGAAASAEPRTVEEIMADHPDMDRAEAQQVAELTEAGAAVGGTMVAGFGIIGAGIVWIIGMVPLIVMYFVFKPSGATTIQVQQVVGGPPGSAQQHRQDRSH